MIQPVNNSLSIVAVGDISLSGAYRHPRFCHDTPWSSLESDWQDADLRLGNLEAPITEEQKVSKTKFALRANSTAKSILQNSNFDVLNLANNHAMDFGAKGLDDTTETLKQLEIPFVGCGNNLSQAFEPLVVKTGHQKTGFLSFCDVEQISHLYATTNEAGVAPLDESSTELVRELRPKVDWLIVQLHWGTELSRLPIPAQRDLASKFVESGADAIIGHHPHVVQPMEVIENVPVWYSLGNFTFTNEFWRGIDRKGNAFVGEYKLHPLARESIVAKMTLTKGKEPIAEIQPVSLTKNGTVVPAKNREERMRDWQRLCESLESSNYDELWKQEEMVSGERRRLQTHPGSLLNRIRLKAFQYKLIRPV